MFIMLRLVKTCTFKITNLLKLFAYIFLCLFSFFGSNAARKEKKSAPEPSAGDKESVIALLVEARFMRGARTGRKRKKRWLSE